LFERYGENWSSIVGKLGEVATQLANPGLASSTAKRGHLEGWISFKGKIHSEDTKKLMSLKAKERLKIPSNNSQFGTCWIWHELIGNKKCKKTIFLCISNKDGIREDVLSFRMITATKTKSNFSFDEKIIL